MCPPEESPTREEVEARLDEMRQNPKYQEVMGHTIAGREVVSHRMDGRRNGFLLLVVAIVGYLAWQRGLLEGPLERFGPGALFAVGAIALFVLSRGTSRTHDLKGPAQSREAMVIAKRHNEPGEKPGRPAGLDNRYYVTLMDRQGVQSELSVKRTLYQRLVKGDSGAAFIKGRTLIRFESLA